MAVMRRVLLKPQHSALSSETGIEWQSRALVFRGVHSPRERYATRLIEMKMV